MVVTCKKVPSAERPKFERFNFNMHHHCRHHHQGEPHAHDGKSFEEANKQYFTENVGEFEKPQNTELAKRCRLPDPMMPFERIILTVVRFLGLPMSSENTIHSVRKQQS